MLFRGSAANPPPPASWGRGPPGAAEAAGFFAVAVAFFAHNVHHAATTLEIDPAYTAQIAADFDFQSACFEL